MKILILGANGFIGNALVKKLSKNKKKQIFGMDLYNDKLEHSLHNKNFKFVKGDINIDNEWIERHIKKCDVIIPLIAIATPNIYVKNPLSVFELDFESNLKIVKWVAKYKKHIVFPSTSEVYGMSNDKKFNEYKTNLVVGPVHTSRWIYSTSKQLLDRVIVAYGDRNALTYTLFRPFNWIGPKLDSLKQAQLGNGRVLTIMINNLIKKNNIILVDGGIQKRSFTYIDDGINALVRIIDNKNKLNKKIFNIGNPKNNISIKKFCEIVVNEFDKVSLKAFKGKIISKTQKEFYGNGYEDIKFRVPDVSEAKKYLKWEPKTSLKQAIKLTIHSYKDQILNES